MSAPESLDTRGLLCPLPVIRTQDRIRTMTAGEELIILATDPGTLQDIPAWCRVHGHQLIEAESEHESERSITLYRFRIRVSG